MTTHPTGGATAGVPRDLKRIEIIIASHRAYPWPGNLHPAPAPAAKLYEAVKAELEADDRRLPSPKEFGAKLTELGYERRKTEAGHVWLGLTIETRLERARAAVLGDGLGSGLYWQEIERRFLGHVAKVHDGKRWACSHGIPENVWGEAKAAVDADPYRIDQLIQERFGSALRWRPGDPEDHAAPPRSPFLEGLLTAPDPEPEPDQW